MKEQEFRQALQRMSAPASFSAERKRAVMEQIQSERNKRRVRFPVLRKRTVVLVMLALLLVIAVGAMAADGFGILTFLRDRGKAPSADQLLNLYDTQYVHSAERRELDLVDPFITEALYEDGTLYLAVTLTPVKEKTMVVPVPGVAKRKSDWGVTELSEIDPSTFTLREAMQNDAYADVTVLDYAKAHGFEQVVLVEGYAVSMYSNQSSWIKDEFEGVQHAEYNLLADGALQLVVEVGYRPDLTFADRRSDTAGLSVSAWAFDAEEEEFLYGYGASAHATFVLPDDRERLRSIPEDAHDIVGYIGEVEYVSVAPYDEENMTIVIVLNLRDEATEDTWMSGPAWILMDEAGNRLCEVDTTQFYGLRGMIDQEGNRTVITHGVFPAAFMPESGKLILRAENRINKNIVYDEYTYTLLPDLQAERDPNHPEFDWPTQ